MIDQTIKEAFESLRYGDCFSKPELINSESSKVISDSYIKAIAMLNKWITEAVLAGKKGIYIDAGCERHNPGKEINKDHVWFWNFYNQCEIPTGNPLRLYIESNGYRMETYLGITIFWG